MGLDKPAIKDWMFTGLAGIPYDLAIDMWYALKHWGVIYTDYMAQPPEYWRAMRSLDAVYGTKYLRNKPPDKREK